MGRHKKHISLWHSSAAVTQGPSVTRPLVQNSALKEMVSIIKQSSVVKTAQALGLCSNPGLAIDWLWDLREFLNSSGFSSRIYEMDVIIVSPS